MPAQFNSGYRFSADAGPVAYQYQHAAAGLTHFARGVPQLPGPLRGAPVTRPNTDCPGSDIGFGTSANLSGCVDQCNAMRDCRGLVFDQISSEQGDCQNSDPSVFCCLFKTSCLNFSPKEGDTAWASGAAPAEPSERISAARTTEPSRHRPSPPTDPPPYLTPLAQYRMFDREVAGMDDGGRLLWRVGDQSGLPGVGKCYRNSSNMPIGVPSAALVLSYVWLYSWPNGSPISPLPPLPNTHISYACSGSQCEQRLDKSGPYWTSNCDQNCSAA